MPSVQICIIHYTIFETVKAHACTLEIFDIRYILICFMFLGSCIRNCAMAISEPLKWNLVL